MIIKKLQKYWDIRQPIFLQHQKKWDGTVITPYHQNKYLKNTKEHVQKQTPIRKQTIIRAYGDILNEEKKSREV